MSRAISALLDQPESVIKRAVRILEAKNGYPSHDVRHLAQNIQTVRTKIAQLGLDADDTTAEELYHALQVRYQNDSQAFDLSQSLVNQTDDQRLAAAVKLVSQSSHLPEVWSLKSHSAKNLIKAQPPKKIMKHLGYRSVDSLLKRQNLAELHLMFEQYESATWNRTYFKKVSGLDSSCFELQPVKIVSLLASTWGEISSETLVAFDASYGVLGVMPGDAVRSTSTLGLVVQISQALSAFDDMPVSSRIAGISPSLVWWKDNDGLVANLNGQCVSLCIADVVVSKALAGQFSSQQLDSGRQSFWHGLVNRYDNLLTAEEDLKMSFNYRPLVIKAPVNQPAFEYVEDI